MRAIKNEPLRSKYHGIIRNMPLFASLSDAELIDLEKLIKEKHFSKNEVILLEEDTSKYMYIVYSGKVKAVKTSVHGREHILAVHGQGDFFGEMGMLDGRTSPATEIAMKDSEVGLLSKSDFETHLLTNERFVEGIIQMLCSRLREAWTKLKILSFIEAENKVRSILKILSEQHGIKDPRGTIVTMKLTHEEIARQVSLSRETVTRQLDRLLTANEIEVLTNRQILLKPAFFEKTLL